MRRVTGAADHGCNAGAAPAGGYRRSIAGLLFIISIGVIGGSLPVYSQNFQVGKISVCADPIRSRDDPCKEVVPPLSNLKRSTFAAGRIDFKFTVLGNRDAIEYLRSKNFLPVKVGVWRNGFKQAGTIALDISQTDWAAKSGELNAQFEHDGQFRWRSFFHVDLRDSGRISINISNVRGKTVSSDRTPARVSLGLSD